MHLILHFIHLLFTKASSEMVSVEWKPFFRKGKRLWDAKLPKNWTENQ